MPVRSKNTILTKDQWSNQYIMICFRLHWRQISTPKTSLIVLYHSTGSMPLNNYHDFLILHPHAQTEWVGVDKGYAHMKRCWSWIRHMLHATVSTMLAAFPHAISLSNYFLIAPSYWDFLSSFLLICPADTAQSPICIWRLSQCDNKKMVFLEIQYFELPSYKLEEVFYFTQ